MTLLTENLPSRVVNAVSLPVLEDILYRFHTPHTTGVFVLTATPMHRHVRLEFRGTGELEGVVLRSPFFSEDLVLLPASVARLIDHAVAFLVQVANYRSTDVPKDCSPDEPEAASA